MNWEIAFVSYLLVLFDFLKCIINLQQHFFNVFFAGIDTFIESR